MTPVIQALFCRLDVKIAISGDRIDLQTTDQEGHDQDDFLLHWQLQARNHPERKAQDRDVGQQVNEAEDEEKEAEIDAAEGIILGEETGEHGAHD